MSACPCGPNVNKFIKNRSFLLNFTPMTTFRNMAEPRLRRMITVTKFNDIYYNYIYIYYVINTPFSHPYVFYSRKCQFSRNENLVTFVFPLQRLERNNDI
jgi:hypothetical protein